ncbi:MAG: mechanosensitive ion channel family protein [Acidimicrobiales bacterium]
MIFSPASITPLSDFDRWARSDLLEIIMIVTGAVLLTRLVTWLSNRYILKIDARSKARDSLVKSEAEKHRHAVAQVVTWTILVLVYCVMAVLIIQKLGVPITSLVAPATVAGVAVGFGAQRVVQDILAGFFIISERQYGFGDSIQISALGATTGVLGTVENVTLRVTSLRTVNGEVVFVPNGQIVQVTNLSRDWARAVIDVPVPATADVNKVNEILRNVGEEAFKDPEIRPLLLDTPSVMGLESMDVDQFVVRLVARTLPGKQFQVGREIRTRIAGAFRQEDIIVPPTLDTGDPTSMAQA